MSSRPPARFIFPCRVRAARGVDADHPARVRDVDARDETARSSIARASGATARRVDGRDAASYIFNENKPKYVENEFM
ncbi:hypothetical protein BE221DRAFT_74333 [Ostreococcus tauri]|uniref:Uncharacterized protein n=1 Tax=Ostreococcus tauri TaxID=70448 RepID=A0A1Y5IHZ1_OSTTA|nr:hypothetical protein BE221DRAFT_74333 [Ostreococcus tauri]